jgi:HD superfamily phosphohydrolase/serine/threonine protein kinase
MRDHSPWHKAPVGGEYYVFRDPVHNLIEIDDASEGRLIRRILRTREVQRLRFLAQNGLCRFVYPGLEGTRFPHSLGAFHIARQIMHSIVDRQPSVADGFPDSLKITPRDSLAFSIAALLHDIGHGPLSHVWEHRDSRTPFAEYDHEKMSVDILSSPDTEIGRFFFQSLRTEFPQFRELGQDVLAFLNKSHRLYYLLPLLSGNLDVDRLDFMVRDSQNAGVPYGLHDIDWIVRSFRFARITQYLASSGDLDIVEPFWTIALDGRKGLSTLVQFLNARENMYSLVYFHKTARSAQMLLVNILRRASSLAAKGSAIGVRNSSLFRYLTGTELNVRDIISLDDSDLWVQLKYWATSDIDQILTKLSKRMLNRTYYKVFSFKEKHAYDLLRELDAGRHITSLVRAKRNCSDEEASYYYAFDTVSFNKVGRPQARPQDSVWIMDETAEGHRYTALHSYWAGDGEAAIKELDVNSYYLMVDESIVEEVNIIVERILYASSQSLQVDTRNVPESYKLLTALGREGAWKAVYLGTTANPGDEVETIFALKCYKPNVNASSALDRDVRSVNLLLQSVEGADYLARSSYLGTINGYTWLRESLWSSSLFDLTTSTGPFRDILDIAQLGHDLSFGLRALHEKNLRHTDIKPDNCGVIRRRGGVKRYVLGDFGCMSPWPNEVPLPELMGTLRTRAPEVILDAKAISLKADVWALGATIAAACLLRYPFMKIEVPHEELPAVRQREQQQREQMDILVPEYRTGIKDSLPPILSNVLWPCFLEAAERSDAQALATAFANMRDQIAKMEHKQQMRVRKAWARTEDLISLKTISPESDIRDEARAMCDETDYIPPNAFRKLQELV